MIWNREPALFFGLLAAVLSLAAAFGLSISAEQVAALNLALAAVMGFVIRQKVTPSN
jgi:type IV secretory pathway TrbD component